MSTCRIIIITATIILASAQSTAGLILPETSPTQGILSHHDFMTTDNIGQMVASDYTPRSDFTYQVVPGSTHISNGRDFRAVQNALNTWANLPDSDISFNQTRSHNQLSLNTTNGRNEISWISAENFGANAWTDTLDFSSSSIAVAITWYYEDSRQIIERDVYFNDINMDWRTDSDGDTNGGFNVEHIALHELGHVFGLNDVYNPGQAGYEKWMGSYNQDLTMYGYSGFHDDDITLSAHDIAAIAAAHPAAIPEPATILLLALATPILLRK